MYFNTYEKGNTDMKVFISWSGARSKKVALIFRDWLPTVIQALEPFVSSEDIEKGARWNTDIAQELKESSFGLICVTKDNLTAPWLNFEAGALSKSIDNTYVAPLLFDVKPSELKGSPISQFQATSFNVEDVKRLVETLNAAAGNCLSATRLDKAFELCYPDLEKSLNELRSTIIEEDGDGASEATTPNLDPNILEELLETVRNTQRLLGNTDSKLYGNIEEVQKKADEIIAKIERQYEHEVHRTSRKYSPMYIREFAYSGYSDKEYANIFPYNILMVLSIYKDDFPWLYDAGNELVKIICSNVSKKVKIEAANKFRNVFDFTCSHPMMRDLLRNRKESMVLLQELSMAIMMGIDRFISDGNVGD
ncbi:MAG: TIR domain-containing protein [Lachnospiraceae bacterium]|nr:TIR domain-containing protein [Lachnospiraceae bacterium]